MKHLFAVLALACAPAFAGGDHKPPPIPQPPAYRDEVLPPQATARIAVEAGVRQCWDKYLGSTGAFVGLDTFGASAPYQDIYKHRGLTTEAVIAKALELCRR